MRVSNRAVVEQEQVGDPAEALERVLVAVGDRLVGDVAAGHHERLARVRQQQVVKRRVGQHHAEVRRQRRRGVRHRRVRPAAHEHDRPLRGGEQRLVLGRGLGEPPRRVEVAHHQRERLLLAVLARAQPRDGRLVVGPAGEVEAADALDRDDRAGAQRLGHRTRSGSPLAAHRAAAAARSRGRRWAGRGSGGRRGPRTRRGRRRTSRSPPSWSAAGRRGRRARS